MGGKDFDGRNAGRFSILAVGVFSGRVVYIPAFRADFSTTSGVRRRDNEQG
jgi:hypothetical protein